MPPVHLAQGRLGRAGSLVEDGRRSFVLKNVSPSHGACGRRAATAPFRQGGHRVGFRPGAKHPEDVALGVPQSLPRAWGKRVLALPVAEKARALFPQRSKNARDGVSPQHFSGTARWTGGPLCVPCGYAVDEVPAKRIMDSIVPDQVGRGTVSCPIGGARNHPLSHFCMLSSSRRGGVGMRSKTKAPSPCLN